MIYRTPLIAAALAIPGPATATAIVAQDADDGSLMKRLKARAEKAQSVEGLEGLVVVVGIGDEVFMEAGWGRLPNGTLAGADVPFRAERLIEPLTAVATLQLAEKGKLDLDAPIQDALDTLKMEGEKLTAQHLLSHTSGLIGWGAALPTDAADSASPAMLLDIVRGQGFESAPGDCHEYSDANFLVLGAAVEKLMERPLAEVLTSQVLKPAGVESSGFGLDNAPPRSPDAAGSVEFLGTKVRVHDDVHPFGEEAFCASALDLFRIRKCLSDGTLLGEKHLALLTAPTLLNDGSELNYGAGVNLTQLGDFSGFSVGGSAEGTTVHMAYYPEPTITVIVLVADSSAQAIALERDLARIVLDLPLPGVQDLELEAKEMKQFVGSYQVGCTTHVVRSPEDGRGLVMETADRSATRLLYQGQRFFCAERDPDVRVEFILEDGETVARRMVIVDHGRREEAVRM